MDARGKVSKLFLFRTKFLTTFSLVIILYDEPLVDFGYGLPLWGDGLQTEIVRNFDFEISASPIMSENFQIIL